MKIWRYMVGDVVAGGCVLASTSEEATAKVRAFYDELATYCDKNETYIGIEITVWDDGEGFMQKFPDVLEVYLQGGITMKKYVINFTETNYGFAIVEANSKEEAEDIYLDVY